MTICTEGVYDAEFLITYEPGYSVEVCILAEGQDLQPGSVLGQVTLGNVSVGNATAVGTNSGDGTFGAITADAGAPAGTYTVEIVEPASNAGAFFVRKPDGSLDGRGNVGSAYNGSINFTLADGGADFAAGDSFSIAVSYEAGSMQVKAVDPAATNGAQTAMGLLFGRAKTGAGETKKVTVVVRKAVADATLLDFGSLTTDQKAVATAQLKAIGILTR